MNELNQIWEDHWKTSAIESSRVRYMLKEIYPKISNNSDLLKYFILAHVYNLSTAHLLKAEVSLIKAFETGEFDVKELYLVFYFKEFFSEVFLKMVHDLKKQEFIDCWSFAEKAESFIDFSPGHWRELKKGLKGLPGTRPVLFVRRDRKYKGLIVLINDLGELEQKDGKVWSLEALAKGREGKRFFLPNGNTPSGIYRIDSVMPMADNQNLFGKHRRIKIDFLEQEIIEKNFSEEVLSHPWWREGVIASHLSRSLLRIHGTGLKNRKFYTPYFPLVTTSGCISLREDRQVSGQRVLLDKLMESSGLLPSFINEEKIFGHLCVVELDDKPSNLTLKEILELDQ